MTTNSFVLGMTFFVVASEVIFALLFFYLISRNENKIKVHLQVFEQEREELLELQKAVSQELSEYKTVSEQNMSKLNKLASQVEVYVQDGTQRIEKTFQEIVEASQDKFSAEISKIQKTKLSLERTIQSSQESKASLEIVTQSAKRLLNAIDGTIPTEEILKEIQTEKYASARHLIQSGHKASEVAQKLGLTFTEINLLSYSK
jgi:protoporphyrinogen oxidase